MKSATLFALVVLMAACAVQGKPGGMDISKMGKDFMNMAKTAMTAISSFKPEDIKELMTNFQKPEEQKAFGQVIAGMMQGKSEDEMISILMETESGPMIAEKMLPLLEKYKEMQAKYGGAFKKVADKNKKS